ncbi:hypothetical protein [Thermococcus sp.]|uniref:hypothetical protein n=1 Tax=Thermococcus sp. TaxID=35749 RepID=UPI00262A6CD5|nr:hypothetical protein [Thermococcus sp.]
MNRTIKGKVNMLERLLKSKYRGYIVSMKKFGRNEVRPRAEAWESLHLNDIVKFLDLLVLNYYWT